MGDTVLCEIDKGIAWVTLNNPKARNALSGQMRIDLRDVIGDLEHDDAVRCVVLRGAGDHFMAGGDIRAMKERLDIDRETRKRVVIEGIHAIHLPVFAIRRMRKPVIASVRGAAAGFGLGLVAACDLAIAADDAFFTLAYCHIGASPDGGSS
ncbi:MAG: enoyl-CoA hydratase/isomerase family protein, partial [Alphaproteobacteria bacterium]|nr:enoyl-CoA hydratase/isomerase family protein [Alphaproteobacteria bacterium]